MPQNLSTPGGKSQPSIRTLERARRRELGQGFALLEKGDDLPGPGDDLERSAQVPVGLHLVCDLMVLRSPVIVEFPLDKALVRPPGHDALAQPDAGDAGPGEAQLVGPVEEPQLAVALGGVAEAELLRGLSADAVEVGLPPPDGKDVLGLP